MGRHTRRPRGVHLIQVDLQQAAHFGVSPADVRRMVAEVREAMLKTGADTLVLPRCIGWVVEPGRRCRPMRRWRLRQRQGVSGQRAYALAMRRGRDDALQDLLEGVNWGASIEAGIYRRPNPDDYRRAYENTWPKPEPEGEACPS